jgi:hypothetical protein
MFISNWILKEKKKEEKKNLLSIKPLSHHVMCSEIFSIVNK